MATSMSQARPKEMTRWLSLGAVVGPVMFTLGAFALAPLHPGYSIISRPVSALAIGTNGGLMLAAFLLYGVLVTIRVVAVFQGIQDELGPVSRWVCTPLVISPLGALWAGIFTMDHLALHNDGGQAAFGAPVITLPIRRTPAAPCPTLAELRNLDAPGRPADPGPADRVHQQRPGG